MTREEAIKTLKGEAWICCAEKWNEALDMAVSALSENTGEWKHISPAGIYECSCCGQNVMTNDIECYKFCHGCGAKMKGGE